MLVDVAIDQGGCFETSRPTTHRDPTFEVDGVTHYCVANMPGAVPITSTYALTNATLPYVLALADHGVAEAIAARSGPAARASTSPAGKVTHPAVAEGVGIDYVPPEEALGVEHRHGAPQRRPTQRARPSDRATDRRTKMATATLTKLQNFIDGEFVDPAEGETEEVAQPGHRRADRRGAAVHRRGRRPRRRGGPQGVRRLGGDDARRARRWRC